MATFRIFEGVDGPGALDGDTVNRTLAVEFFVTDTGCSLTEIHFWVPSAITGSNHAVRLYQVGSPSTGTLVSGSSKALPAPLQAGWNTAVLDAPIALTADQRYRAAVYFTTDNAYTSTGGYWNSGAGASGRTFGPLTAPNAATATGTQQGSFTDGTDDYPTIAVTAANYWVDVTVDDGLPATAPVVDAGEDTTWILGNEFTRTAVEQSRGSAITDHGWSITAAPGGVSLGEVATDQHLTYTPTVDGDYTFEYQAVNGVGTGSDSFVMSVAEAAPLPYLHMSAGVALRNGTSGHTVDFAASGSDLFTPTAGNELVFLVHGAITHTADGWTRRLAPILTGQLAVFTRTAQAGDTGITLAHNGSDRPVTWTVFEFPAGTTWVGGAVSSPSGDALPTLSGLPGTPVCVVAARGRVAVLDARGASAAWLNAFTEASDLYTPAAAAEGSALTVGFRAEVTATSITPAATSTYSGTWTVSDRQLAVFAVNAPPVGSPAAGPTVVPGRGRPVLNGQTVGLDLGSVTPTAGQTITGYSWAVTSGGGSLSGAATATPTYTAPASGTGRVQVACTVTETGGGATTVVVRVGHGRTIVAAENTLPGATRSTWDLMAALAGISTLQGFCDGFTADRGDTVSFKVAQSDGAGWSAQVWRLGWYGGDGARLYAELTPDAGQLADSQAQPTPGDADGSTAKLSADCSNWAATLTWDPPTWAPSGVYVLRLNRTGGGASHVLFMLRDDARTADLMFMTADSTWTAYNAFGGMGADLLAGNSLYWGTPVDQYDDDAARFVSYNRPWINRAANNPGQTYGSVRWSNFFTTEYAMLRFLERNGYDAKYYGCIDAAGDPTGALLDTVSAAVAVGHNEYWSDNMRAGWEAAKAAGRNLLFACANDVFWRTYGTLPDGAGRPRTYECQKSTINGRGSDRPQWTGTWRDPDGAGKGGNHPENLLTGTIFVVNGPDLRAMTVPFSGGYTTSPLWRRCTAVTSLTTGQVWTSPAQILGFEWNTFGPTGFTGPGIAFVADPPADAVYSSSTTATPGVGVLVDAGDEYSTGIIVEHRLVAHRSSAVTGGMTFSVGTVNWSLGLDDANTWQVGVDNTSPTLQQATVNVLADMGAQPTGLQSGLRSVAAVDWWNPPPAFTTVPTQYPGLTGAAPEFTDATTTVQGVDPNTRLLIVNDGEESVTLTIATPGTARGGLAIADKTVVIPTGAWPVNTKTVDVPADPYRQSDGYCHLTWSDGSENVRFAVFGRVVD